MKHWYYKEKINIFKEENMKKTSKVIVVAIVAVLFVLGASPLFAEGQKEAAAGEAPWDMMQWDSPKPATERLAAQEYIAPANVAEVTEGVDSILHFNAGGMEHDPGTEANFKRFEEVTPVDAKWVEVSDSVLLQKTISALVSQDPNVTSACVSQPAFAMKQLVAGGWLQSWDSVWTPEVQKLYPAGLIEMFKGDDGSFYATVDTQKSGFMYVRTSWLEAAGVEVSADALDTWQEVRAAAKAAREWAVENLDNTFWGIGFPGDHYVTNLMRGTTYSQDGRLLNDDGKFQLTSQEFKNTWNLLVNFIKEDKSAPEAILGWTWNDYQQAFAMGKLAIIVSSLNTNIVRFANPEQSPGVMTDVNGNKVEGGDWIALPMPKWDEDTPDQFIGAQPINLSAMVINKFAPPKAKAAAMVLGEVRMSFEGGKNELLIEGNSPFFPEVLEDPEVVKQVDYTDVRFTSLKNSINEVFPTGSEQVMDMLREYFAIAVTGEMTNNEAIETVQSETEALFGYEVVD